MSEKVGWEAYLRDLFFPDSEDFEPFDLLPLLSYFRFVITEGDMVKAEESFGDELEKGFTTGDGALDKGPSSIHQSIYRCLCVAVKKPQREINNFLLLCNEKWDDVILSERAEVDVGEWWESCSPALRGMFEILLPQLFQPSTIKQ
ncbi:uncharacterized protein LOC130989292 [Salvia miltiorrhiza]|uniref:uncharacterized protein LOC130989292 n=1 Tax=Salvia miltiorrhiza TaxID=226208 RepID=UPI0025AC2EBD|nr:uncharacterized protein LOC130989292 [Salvia miltiorrhiza]